MDQSETLADVLSEFARTMVTDFPIQAILDHLVVRIVEVLPITSAGVTLISPGHDPHHIAASDDAALRYERLQTEIGDGPCVMAYESGEAVSVPDLALDARFPEFAPRAREAGLVAVFTFPLRHGDRRLGALDLYRETPGPLDDESMVAAQTLADVAATYLLNARSRKEAIDSVDRYRTSSLHDPLTGLPNRVLLRQRLDHASQRAQRSHTSLGILFVDLDQFKAVNDVHGHAAGDALLVAVAQRLTRMVRPGDTVARMSGDEFVVLCEDLADTDTTEELAQRIVFVLAQPFKVLDSLVTVTASVGIAFAGRSDEVPDRVLNDADEAMYQAKRAGGARHQLIDLRQRFFAEDRLTLENDLRGATVRGELRLEYQPIVRTLDATIIEVEALLRWDHPTRGVIDPTQVVSIAEQGDFIVDIGCWVLQQACNDRQRLVSPHGATDLGMCVNVSPHQLLAEGFCRSVEDILGSTGMPARRLTLELTESVYVEDSDRALVVLEELHELGVRLALDDFGTGYSSLSYLRRFPMDVIKVDRSFITDLGQDSPTTPIVGAVINLAHALGMSVVAEGVETAEQHRQLLELGCELCQGFFFAVPMSIDDLDRRMCAA